MTWSGIADVVAETLEAWRDEPIEQVESVLAATRRPGPGPGQWWPAVLGTGTAEVALPLV